MVEGASGDRSMQTALCAVWYDAEGGRRRDYVTVMLGLSLFVTNLSPRGCWRAVGTQCEPVGSEYEPARSDSVTECEPGKGDVCKPACGYLRAATFSKSSPVFTIPPIQPPLRLMLAETPSPHGSGASRVTVGTMSAGSVRVVTLPHICVGYC